MHYIALFYKIITIYWPLIILTISIFSIIYLLKWPLVRDVKINIFTYIGALLYISFYILFFIALRWVQINNEVDLKKIPDGMENFIYIYNKSFFNLVFYTLLIIFVILLWLYIFIKLREKLSYQVWKIYFYYRYKCLITEYKKPRIDQIESIKFFEKYLSYYEFCHKISHYLIIFCKKVRLFAVAKRLNNLKYIQYLIRFIIIFLIFVFIFYDCYFNNFVLSMTKYYLFFYMIFSLWYKISTFFRYESPFIDEIIFEITYCAPNVVYINLTREEEEFLESYLKNAKVVDIDFLCTFIWATPPVAYYKRFVYTEVQDILDISENGYNRIPYNYVYKNKKTQRYFPAAWLKENNGRYYTDQEL